MRRLGGSPLIAVTFVTPGTARKRSCNWVKKADWRAPSGYVSAGTISITASATSATTSERTEENKRSRVVYSPLPSRILVGAPDLGRLVTTRLSVRF
ncbi:MAG: hypothetical protein IIA55_14660 [Gemmatimonadetes bacterium]|nr:hypothetical protein [Gemmatimonadota bacterium]